MSEVKNSVVLDKELRREVRAAAKIKIFASLPFCVAAFAAYVVPSFILGVIFSISFDMDSLRILTMLSLGIVCQIVVLGPVMLGVQYALLGVARGRKNDIIIMFSPLANMHEMLRGIRMMLCLVVRMLFWAIIPTAIYLGGGYVLSNWLEQQGITDINTIMKYLSLLVVVYFILMIPVFARMLSYFMGYATLYDQPEIGVWKATAEGARLMRGQQGSMILFILRFLPWYLGGLFTGGLLTFFGSIYLHVSLYTLRDRLAGGQIQS